MDFNTFEPDGKAGLLRKALAQDKNITSFWIFSFSSSLKFNSTLVLWYNKSSSFLSKHVQSFNSALSKTNLQIYLPPVLLTPPPNSHLGRENIRLSESVPSSLAEMTITVKKERRKGGREGETTKKKKKHFPIFISALESLWSDPVQYVTILSYCPPLKSRPGKIF